MAQVKEEQNRNKTATGFAGGSSRGEATKAEGRLGNSTENVRSNILPKKEAAENSKTQEKQTKTRGYKTFKLLRASSYLLRRFSEGEQKQRVTSCRFSVISQQNPVKVMHAKGRSFYQGLQVCGSVWSCPVCSDKISQTRREEANLALEYARKNNLYVYMITMTASHQLGDDLRELKETMMTAWRKMQRRQGWKKLRQEADKDTGVVTSKGIVGTIRALEVTYGRNGWHPHFHIIVFSSRRIQGKLEELSKTWVETLETLDLSASEEHGWQVQNASEVGNYIAKFGAAEEISMGSKKAGRFGSRTPFQLLDDYVSEKSSRAGDLFVEFALAFKGSRQLNWSDGLKKLVGVDEIDDEEAAKQEDDAVLHGVISYDDWKGDKKYLGHIGARYRRVKILEASDRGPEACTQAIYENVTDEDLWFDTETSQMNDQEPLIDDEDIQPIRSRSSGEMQQSDDPSCYKNRENVGGEEWQRILDSAVRALSSVPRETTRNGTYERSETPPRDGGTG